MRKGYQSGRKDRWLDARLTGLNMVLAQAGLDLSAKRVVALTILIAVGLWLITASLSGLGLQFQSLGNTALSFAGASVLATIGVWSWIQSKRRARIRKLEEQLPLALDIVTRAVRAGHPAVAAVRLAAEELSDPIGSELGLVVDETNYGAEFREALLNMGRRTGSPDVHFFAVSVSIQAETGGNLAEILQGLATVMRGRQTLGKRVKALASEGQASALILSILPVGVVGFQFMSHPTYYSDKFNDPIFWPVVALTLGLYGMGWIMINRIINFKY
jgi:tight adherence protein B